MRTRKQLRLSRYIAESLFGKSLTKLGLGSAIVALSLATTSAQTVTISSGIDTFIAATQTASSGVNNAAATVTIDGGANNLGDGSWTQALIRYDNLFGTGTGKIPVGATVLGAFYQVRTGTGGNDQSGNNMGIYALTSPFAETTATWVNSYGANGVQVGTEALANPDSVRNAGAYQTAVVNFDVTSSVRNWAAQANPNTANLGWVITPTAGTDGWAFASSNNTTAANRPVFTAYYTTNTNLQNLVWNAATTTGTLDTTVTNTPWLNPASAPAPFRIGDTVVLSQDAPAPVTITVAAGGATPSATVVNHTSGTYTLTGGAINLNLTKTNAGTLVLASANNFNEVALGGGLVELQANNALGSTGLATLSDGVTLRPTTASQTTTKNVNFVNGTIDVTGTNQFTLNGVTSGTGTVFKTGSGTLSFTGGSNFTGTLDIQAGRVIVADPGNTLGTSGDFNAGSVIVRNGTAFQFGSATPITENPDLPNSTYITVETGGVVDWYILEDFGGFNLQGGAINIGGGGPNIAANLGQFQNGSIVGTGAGRTLAIASSGSFAKTTSGTVTVTNAEISAIGPVSIFAGTLSTDSGISGTGTVFLGDNATTATLQFRGATTDTIAKNLIVATAGGNIDIQDAGGKRIWSGNVLGDGPIAKIGAGELSLTGTNGSFSGPLNVQAGTLSFTNGALPASAIVTVADGATLAKNDTTQSSLASLTLGSTTGGNLQLTLDGSVTSATINITNPNGLTAFGTSVIKVASTGLIPLGTYPLIDYDGTLGGNGFAGFALQLPARTLGSLFNNTTDARIDLTITGTDTIKWSGVASGVWDINASQNWKLVSAGTATTYLQAATPGDTVAFDDTASTGTITLTTSVSPNSVTFSNDTLNYTIAGTGKISGSTGIVKSGVAAVTIGTANDFSGAVAISAGSLTFTGNNSVTGAVSATGGTLSFSGLNTFDGAVNVNGGTATFGSGNTFNQPVVLTSGALTLNNASTITAGLQNNGGTLTVNGANTINAVTLAGGTTIVTANNALGATGTIAINSNAVFRSSGAAISSSRGLAFGIDGAKIDVTGTDVFSLTGATSGISTVTKTGTGTWEIMGTTSFTGNLEITAGSVVLQGSVTSPANGDLNAAFINVRNGGRFQFGQTVALTGEDPDLPANTVVTADTGGVIDWNVGESLGGINLNGGTLNALRGSPSGAAGIDSIWTSGAVNASTTALGYGGAGKVIKTGSPTDIVTVTDAVLNNTGGLTLQGGTLSTNGAITATGDLTFDGGTLQLRHTAAFATAKPVVLNPGGGTLEVANAVTLSGIVSGSGKLTKFGAGSLVLTGATNTFTGPIDVSQGTLIASAGLTPTTVVSVLDSGTFAASSTASATIAALNLGVAGGAKLAFDVTVVPTVAPLNVTNVGGVNWSGTNSIIVASQNPLTVGSVPLVHYNTSLGSSNLAQLALVLPPRVVASLVDNTTNSTLDLNVTGVDFIKWTGASGSAWDVNTSQNWKTASANAVTTFLQPDTIGDTVSFDDSATGGTAIVLGTAVRPASTIFDNTALNYTVSGAGSIAGTGALTKTGTGTVVLTTSNTYAGTTTINAGTLQLGDGGILGSVGTGGIAISTDGTLVFNRSDSTLLNNVFSGTGNIVKNGTGTVTLDSNSTGFTGTLTVNAGTFQLANPGTPAVHNFNAASIVVNNGGTFEFVGPTGNANLPPETYITVNAGGIVNWSEGENFGGLNLNGGALNLAASVTLEGVTNSGFTSGTITGTGGNVAGARGIDKTTVGTVTVIGAGLITTGGLNITAGTISTDSAISDTGTLSFGDASTARGTLQLRTATSGTLNKPTIVNAGGGVIDVTQASTTITSTGATDLLDGATFVKSGAGELQVNGIATYGNNSTLRAAAGTLTLNPTIAPNVGTGVTLSIAPGATVNVGGTVDPLSSGGNTIAVVNDSTTGLHITAGAKQTGAISGVGTTTLTAGSGLLASSVTQGGLTIGAGAKATVATNGTNTGVSRLGSLTIDATGRLDLGDNDLIVDGGNLATLTAQLKSGLDLSGTFGSGPGITSGVAAANGNGTTVLGVAPNGELGYTTFSGQAVNANAVLVKYTYFGDADLNGVVDTTTDFDLYLTGLTGGGSGWLYGDFDYNGVVDTTTDFDLYLTGLTGQSGTLLTSGGGGLGLTTQAVPEPSLVVCGAVGTLGLAVYGLRRRRVRTTG